MMNQIVRMRVTVLLIIVAVMWTNDTIWGNVRMESLQSNFEITRGVNISHWLSQSKDRGELRKSKFGKDEVAFLKKMGFDHLRLPIDEEQLFTPSGDVDAETMGLMHQAISWCREFQMRIIVDFHILRSHHFGNNERPLWADPIEQDKFIHLWKLINRELEKYPENLLAYELLNEPVAPENEVWNELVKRLIKELREVAPKRMLILGSNSYNSVNTIKDLQIPKGDRNIMLTFHCYEPYLLTHYRASWTDFAKLDVTLTYPGDLINEKDFEKLSDEEKKIVAPYKRMYSKRTIAHEIEQALKVAKENGVRLYCGEFGCLPFGNHASRYNWYRDLISIFQKKKVAYACWDYKSIFGFCNTDKAIKDGVLLAILQGKDIRDWEQKNLIEAEKCEMTGSSLSIIANPYASNGEVVKDFFGNCSLIFNVVTENAGECLFKIRYTSGEDVGLNLQIGNSRQVIRCPNTGGWYDKFEETEIYINLPKGQSVLCVTPGTNGGPILDKFELFKEVTD